MKLEITKERDTPLLSRKRVTLTAEYEGSTPSRKEVRKAVADKLGADENLTIIKHIYTRFGMKRSKIICHVYKNKEDMDKFEQAGLVKKHQQKKEEKEAGSEDSAPEKESAEAGKEGSGEEKEKTENKEEKQREPEKEEKAKESKEGETGEEKQEPKEEAKAD